MVQRRLRFLPWHAAPDLSELVLLMPALPTVWLMKQYYFDLKRSLFPAPFGQSLLAWMAEIIAEKSQ
jgi:hypothetical protein